MAPKSAGDEIYVSGEGAISAVLQGKIDKDAKKLNPIAGIIITLILFIAFFAFRAALLPNLIVVATVGGTLGIMVASGVYFYVITNGLIVCLIGIAVADSIHVFSQYYEEFRDNPDLEQQELVVRAMSKIWRPITLTSLTTVAGFLALYTTNDTPQFKPLAFLALLGLPLHGFIR